MREEINLQERKNKSGKDHKELETSEKVGGSIKDYDSFERSEEETSRKHSNSNFEVRNSLDSNIDKREEEKKINCRFWLEMYEC